MDTPKNTRPGALSGTMQPFDAEPLEDETVDTETQGGIVVPAGDLDARLAWVSDSDDYDERHARADALWTHEVDTGAPEHELDELREKLVDAVYREDDAQQVQGQVAQTDGPPGPAVNAETGQVTQPGEPLPPIEQDGGQAIPPQTVSPEGIDATTTVGENPAPDGSGDDQATQSTAEGSEAGSGDDSAPSDAETTGDDGQNSTSSPGDASGT